VIQGWVAGRFAFFQEPVDLFLVQERQFCLVDLELSQLAQRVFTFPVALAVEFIEYRCEVRLFMNAPGSSPAWLSE
jgi:hypothetical protein